MISLESLRRFIIRNADLTVHLGEDLTALLPYIALVVVGYAVEKNFVSRPALMSNGVAVSSYTSLMINPSLAALLYSFIGLVIGVIAMASYVSGESLPEEFYYFGWAWCSVAVGGYLLVFEIGIV